MNIIQFSPAEIQQRHVDEAFTAPSAHSLQLLESAHATTLANEIALTVHRESLSEMPARDRAACRFVGVHAVRATKDCWLREARKSAMRECVKAMRDECGDALAQLPDEHLRALAGILVGAVLSGYNGILEGSRHLSPGDYLRITAGDK
jgi:hypothetical protein